MEFKNVAWSIKQLSKMINKETIKFNYPIQRAGEQWNIWEKSLWIHSLAGSYPIPPIYFLSYEEERIIKDSPQLVPIRQTLDGKQRLTNTHNYLNDGYKLDPATPTVTIEGMEYNMAGLLFSELDEEVQDMILSRTLLTYTLDQAKTTDEEIEDIFYRLNNGKSLTTQQKAKALMGTKWAKIIQELGEHKLVSEYASFSAGQIKTDAHLTAIMQTMMMLDSDYEYKNVSQNEISKYGQTFKDETEHKEELAKKVKQAMDFVYYGFDNEEKSKKETTLLKKVHFPMVLITALRAIEKDIDSDSFYEWLMDFKKSLKNTNAAIPTNYLDYAGKGTTDKLMALGRKKAMMEHMETYLMN
jgi:hypothetical protein